MRVLISGYYGFRNAGDEAILAGLIRMFRELRPDVQFTVVSASSSWTRATHRVDAVSRNRIRAIVAALRQADLVLSGGGSLLQDVTGLKSIPYYLGIAAMGLALRKPTMLIAQGVGPVRHPLSRALVRLVANRVHAITVRDLEAAQEFRRLGVQRPPVVLAADAALALPPGSRDRGRHLWAEAGADPARPLLAVSVRPWPVAAAFADALAAGLARLALATGAQVALVPLQWPHDLGPAECLATRIRGLAPAAAPVVARVEGDFRQAMDLIAGADLLVGMRYHSLVFAAMAGVPILGISYDPKNEHFLRQVGLHPVGSTADLNPERLATAGLAAWQDRERLAWQLRAATANLAQQARTSARVALDLVQAAK